MKVRMIGSHGGMTPVGECLLYAFTDALGGKQLPDHMLPDSNGDMDITMTVNGVEFQFQTLMEVFLKSLDSMVERKACELVQDKASKLDSLLCELQEEIRWKCREVFPKAFMRED